MFSSACSSVTWCLYVCGVSPPAAACKTVSLISNVMPNRASDSQLNTEEAQRRFEDTSTTVTHYVCKLYDITGSSFQIQMNHIIWGLKHQTVLVWNHCNLFIVLILLQCLSYFWLNIIGLSQNLVKCVVKWSHATNCNFRMTIWHYIFSTGRCLHPKQMNEGKHYSFTAEDCRRP